MYFSTVTEVNVSDWNVSDSTVQLTKLRHPFVMTVSDTGTSVMFQIVKECMLDTYAPFNKPTK